VQKCEKQVESNAELSEVRHEKLKIFIDYIIPTIEMFFDDVSEILEKAHVGKVAPKEEAPKRKKRTITPEIVREKLLAVKELDSEKLNGLSDEELSDYLQVLDLYHSEYQSQRTGLTGALKIKHYVFVFQWLNTIEESLVKLHATELAAGCREQIDANKDLTAIRPSRVTVYVTYLLSSLSILTTDILALGLPKKLEITGSKENASKKAEFEVLAAGDSEDSKKILVVNKMKMFKNSLKNALGNRGFTIIGTSSAEDAASYIQTENPDLFIIDEDLQGTDGLLLIKIIRASGQMAPIIFTTSKITKDKMVKFMAAGAADFIMKPISPTDVQKKVFKHLAQ
jgi:CheY-like chemotaxis protein